MSTMMCAPKISARRVSVTSISDCSSVAGCMPARTYLIASIDVNVRPNHMRSGRRSGRGCSHGSTIPSGMRATGGPPGGQGRGRPPGEPTEPADGRGQEDPDHDEAQEHQRRAFDHAVVELEAVLEIDRRDHEVERARSGPAIEHLD